MYMQNTAVFKDLRFTPTVSKIFPCPETVSMKKNRSSYSKILSFCNYNSVCVLHFADIHRISSVYLPIIKFEMSFRSVKWKGS